MSDQTSSDPLSKGDLNHTPSGNETDWRKHQLPLLKGGQASLVPCDGNKTPIAGKNWQDKGCTAAEIAAMNDPRIQAVGVITAKTNFVCIDVDGPNALPFCKHHNLPLPPTWSVGRSNNSTRIKHIYGIRSEQKAQLPKKPGKRSWPEHQLEVFWNSQQFIVAGNHPSGSHYIWHGTPTDIAYLPDEWFTILQKQDTSTSQSSFTAGDLKLRYHIPPVPICLQDLLTRDNSLRVQSGFLTGRRNNELFAFAVDAYSAESEALRRDAVLDSTADQLIQVALSHTDQSDFKNPEIKTILRSAKSKCTLTHGFDKRWNYVTKPKKKQNPYEEQAQKIKTNQLLTEDQIEAVAQLFPSARTERGNKSPIDSGDLTLMITGVLGDRLTYNELGYKIELDKQPLRDIERTTLLTALKNRYYRLNDLTLIEALTSAAYKNAYHPVQDYLQDLLNNPFMEDVDLYSLSSTFLGAEGPLYATILQRCLVGAVARAMNPGCQMDYICVLQGAQGIGKTRFWKILFGDWFKVFNGELGNKDSYLLLHDSWGIELGEIDGITSKKEAAKLKNFASTCVDYLRPPYGRIVQEFKRPSILVGSCNRDDFLNDETGERRYWVIPVSKQLDREKLYQWRDAIWRAAAITWKSGVLPYLPSDLELENEKNNKRYSKGSVLEPHLAQYLEDKQIASKSKVKEFVNSLNLVNPSWVDKEISATMVRLSWRTHQYKGYPRVWVLDTPEAVNLGRALVRTLDHSVNTF